ncbi:TPR repeat protein [Penicillium frequentans]|uniref:TPR repeat protein n=1 Tax=Penicillium frequentans TaxID=3151616 RepID=A0AAD6D1C3_9EURO|nr:TPR repeat protein [Penicillium glabrum]
MSEFEIIGSISAIITLLDASINIYDCARSDMKLSQTFEVVRCRLPIILRIFQSCKSYLEQCQASMPSDACEALETILDACDKKAGNLREIFEIVMTGGQETWWKRYANAIRRLGKGNKVDELMATLARNVQLIVNNHVVNSATLEQYVEFELEDILKDMKSIKTSITEENLRTLTFQGGGETQTNNINNGSGQQINNNAHVETQYFQSVTLKQREVFSFRGPVGKYLGQAPYISSELFIGRSSELDEISKILQPNHATQKQNRLVLGGMGGIGKTQLAINYAASVYESYSSVFWLNAASESALKDSFRFIARFIFDTQYLVISETEEIVRRTHQWLSDGRNPGWLLIFDNYDNPDNFKIDNYYPPASHGAIMVTTRRPDLVAGRTFDIRPLQHNKDCLAILQTRSKRENVHLDPYATRLVERLAGLPLALATAGTYLQRSSLTFQRYLQEYDKCWNIDPRRQTKLQEYQERTFYTTWDLSYACLKKEDLDAAELLKLLAYFGNQSVWYDLFYAGLGDSSPKWLHSIFKDDMNFNGLMRILTEYYFLEVQQTTQSWSMHNCVYDWVLAVLNKDIHTEYYWYAVDCVYAHISKDTVNPLGHVSYSRLAIHATQLIQRRFLQSDTISTAMPSRLDKISRISKLLEGQDQLIAAERMSAQLLAGRERALGTSHIFTLNSVNDLGNLLCDQGKLGEAEQMYMRALAGKERVLGSAHISTLDTVNNLGLLYREQGKLDKAEHMYLRALAGYEKALGPDDLLALDTVNNLGNLYRHQGKLDESEKLHIRALAWREKILGLDHISTLGTVNNLGLLYQKQSKMVEAEQMYLRALAGYEKAIGPDHTSTLDTVNNLGNLYHQQGKLDEAEQAYMRALVGRERALGPDHILTLGTVNNLGNLYRHQGKLGQAEKMYIRALAGRETALGPDHISTIRTVSNLRFLYCDQGKSDEAEQMQ